MIWSLRLRSKANNPGRVELSSKPPSLARNSLILQQKARWLVGLALTAGYEPRLRWSDCTLVVENVVNYLSTTTTASPSWVHTCGGTGKADGWYAGWISRASLVPVLCRIKVLNWIYLWNLDLSLEFGFISGNWIYLQHLELSLNLLVK